MPAFLLELLMMLGGTAAADGGMALARRFLGKAAAEGAEKVAGRVATKIPTAIGKKFLTPQRLVTAAGAGAGLLGGTALFGAGSHAAGTLLGVNDNEPYMPHGAESLMGGPVGESFPDIDSLVQQLSEQQNGGDVDQDGDGKNPSLETLIRGLPAGLAGGRLM